MKNTMKCLGIIALAAVIGFASCDNGTTREPEPEFIVHTYKSVKNEITYTLEIFQPFEESAVDGETLVAYTPAAGDTYKLTIIYPDDTTVTSSGTVALSSTTSSTAIFNLSNGVNLKVTITKEGALTNIAGTIIPDPVPTGSPIQSEPGEMLQPITAPGTVTSDGNGSPPSVNYASGGGDGTGGTGGTGGSTGIAPTVTTTTLPGGTVGTAYSQTLTATGSTPITWSIDTGALPGGLNLSTAGVISGTPTTANTYNFTVKATNAAGSGTKAFFIVIAPGGTSGTGGGTGGNGGIGGEPIPAKTLISITAVYTQPTEIFPDTSLETLKEGLTVTAHYSNNTTAPVTNYTLSGTLATGTSTVTVSYAEGGVTKTATFTVTVDAPHEHIWSAWTVHIAATCTTAGEERENCTADPPHYNERPIAALGHDAGVWHITVAATCIATGTRELRCTRDQFVLQTDTTTLTALGHDWQPVSDTATVTADGHEGQVCNNNHAHDELKTTYATGTAGLAYNLIGTTAYRVNNGGVRTFTAVHIPAYHRPDATSPYLPVTQIAYGSNTLDSNAFGGTGSGANANTTLTSVTFAPDSQLTTISRCAFSNCTGLTGITFPASVPSIYEGVFASCTSLASFTIPASVTDISQYAFDDCTSLASVTFEGTLASGQINSTAFPGDLRTKYLDAVNGGPGTYTRTPPNLSWSLQS